MPKKLPDIIYKGSLETSHYSFEAYSTTEDGARRALKRAWLTHTRAARRVGATNLYKWSELWEGGDANVMSMYMDTGYCDRSICDNTMNGVKDL